MVSETPPDDYRLLVPRDWFRIDLCQDRWRPQLKLYADRRAAAHRMPSATRAELWKALRNVTEAGVAKGALEIYLRADTAESAVTPVSLLVSLMATGELPGGGVDSLAELLAGRHPAATVTRPEHPAGPAVLVTTAESLDLYVEIPGHRGFLHLSFRIPVSGSTGPMGELCRAIGDSLRWSRT
ncbi:hypothetical protein CLM85_32415 [Streptomyces albidoflavus]|nr:hypothetical protein CLM81_16935 [Streptomyces albidoflavus]PAX91882.1 hypothetical protein CLM82_06790 [Streptomyces albidoflavus]PBO17006.1 hypothetical protein CLM83_20655 [Streptomyces albidoflavus]PBO20775.1 hypothetical protein CLM85_32415 [Streptomyces albidoflavus]PBO28418.1 hypothetical protein CLM84_20145 [Streptomyces albidoflavus]